MFQRVVGWLSNIISVFQNDVYDHEVIFFTSHEMNRMLIRNFSDSFQNLLLFYSGWPNVTGEDFEVIRYFGVDVCRDVQSVSFLRLFYAFSHLTEPSMSLSSRQHRARVSYSMLPTEIMLTSLVFISTKVSLVLPSTVVEGWLVQRQTTSTTMASGTLWVQPISCLACTFKVFIIWIINKCTILGYQIVIINFCKARRKKSTSVFMSAACCSQGLQVAWEGWIWLTEIGDFCGWQ